MILRVASLTGYVVCVLAIIVLLVEKSLIAGELWLQVLQVLSLLLMVWARLTFGRRSFHAAADPTEGGIITSGPYRLIRHPIYASVLYVIWIGVLSHRAPLSIVLGLIASAGLAIRMYAEEKLVIARYPEYAVYAGRTKRVVPFVL